MFFKKKPFPTKVDYYKIPLIDLSVKPENTPEELGYLFEYSVVDDSSAYLDYQKVPSLSANADTGYCGNVVLKDGTVVTSSYGIFSPEEKERGKYDTDKGKQKRKTFIVSKRIKLDDVEKFIK